MNTVYVKLRIRENTNKYRKMLSTDENVYVALSELIGATYEYSAGAVLEEGEWFKVVEASQQPYAIDIISQKSDTADYDSLGRGEFSRIEYIFVNNGEAIFFQNISKSKLVSKKRIGCIWEEYEYESDSEEIAINNLPDAIYSIEDDILYFRKIEPLVKIFKGISDLYREATDDETEQFLQNDFITLKDDYGKESVKTANRKRIALAVKTLSELTTEEKDNIFNYIGEYCPTLKTEDNSFAIGNEDELKMVLFGIEQRFYTTLVGGEKRIANSIIAFN